MCNNIGYYGEKLSWFASFREVQVAFFFQLDIFKIHLASAALITIIYYHYAFIISWSLQLLDETWLCAADLRLGFNCSRDQDWAYSKYILMLPDYFFFRLASKDYAPALWTKSHTMLTRLLGASNVAHLLWTTNLYSFSWQLATVRWKSWQWLLQGNKSSSW